MASVTNFKLTLLRSFSLSNKKKIALKVNISNADYKSWRFTIRPILSYVSFSFFFFTVGKSFSVELPVGFASKIKTWIFTEQVEINLPLCKWNAVSNC